jgi:hypothetical protein
MKIDIIHQEPNMECFEILFRIYNINHWFIPLGFCIKQLIF